MLGLLIPYIPRKILEITWKSVKREDEEEANQIFIFE